MGLPAVDIHRVEPGLAMPTGKPSSPHLHTTTSRFLTLCKARKPRRSQEAKTGEEDVADTHNGSSIETTNYVASHSSLLRIIFFSLGRYSPSDSQLKPTRHVIPCPVSSVCPCNGDGGGAREDAPNGRHHHLYSPAPQSPPVYRVQPTVPSTRIRQVLQRRIYMTVFSRQLTDCIRHYSQQWPPMSKRACVRASKADQSPGVGRWGR
ncbi:hypothetical protein IWZ03DRAFT_97825 [Phyllosticta citriasiana]|uniref:Uncharacterized protein n=1 Tax=Phyllosticta citriasiana TaxID=595635 RepID=A0ABR1KTV8_9PEZI